MGMARRTVAVPELHLLILLTGVSGLNLLVYEVSSYQCMRTSAASACGRKLLVYEGLSDE